MNADHSHGHTPEPAEFRRRWQEYLATNGLNSTQQRELIVDLFLRSHDHVSIDDLLAKVRKKNPKVGYATVYRTLKLLVEAGVATQRQFGDNQSRFELAGAHHDHLICEKCGLILEFEDNAIEELQDAVAERLGGFKVTRHKHELYAICPKEQGKPGGTCPKEQRGKRSN